MPGAKLTSLIVPAILAFVLSSGAAYAQATRTWVSGVGDDVNPCSRTAPCKTFAGAISKTAPGGEIDALDPGGFGGLTITKSITIDGGGGQVASVLVGGSNGIVVAAGATDVVQLRNLRFQGLLGNGGSPGNAGINGIKFISGLALHIESCNLFGFNNAGIDIETGTSSLTFVFNTTTNNNANGIILKPTGGAARLTMTNGRVDENSGFGLKADGSAGGSPAVLVSRSEFHHNNTGIGGVGSNTSILLDRTSIVLNGTGISAGAAHVLSYGNNPINGNGVDGAPTSTIPLN